MKPAILAILLIFPALVSAEPFDTADRALFATVIVAQVFDGMTTAAGLSSHPESDIYDIWNWKYGTSRPSASRMWTTKAVEVGIAYGVARMLPGKYRKLFLGGTAALLFSCGASNGFSFKIRY